MSPSFESLFNPNDATESDVIEEQQVCLRPNPLQYRGFRHYFTPDILLFLKYFHRPERTEQGIDYVRQNPHYFKHHTVDSIEIFKKAEWVSSGWRNIRRRREKNATR